MELNIYNADLEFVGIVEAYTSLLWVRKFFKAGAFELVAPATAENVALIKEHMLIEKAGSVEIGFIDGVSVTSDADSQGVITATGFFLSGLLRRRIIFDAAGGDGVFEVIGKQMGAACKNPARQINRLVIDGSGADKITAVYSGQRFYNLAEYCEAVCMHDLFGLCVSLVHASEPYLLLSARFGADRSEAQDDNPHVTFSYEYDNLLNSEYQYSESGAANAVYGYSVAGNDVDGVPPEYLHGDENAGINRMETAVEVNAVTDSYDYTYISDYTGEGDPVYTTEKRKRVNGAATLKLLRIETENGVRKINENITGGVYFDGGYKTEYDLGDIVTVLFSGRKTIQHLRIYEVTEFYDETGVKTEPTFGSPLRTIADFIKTT